MASKNGEADAEWTDQKSNRRCDLIDKKYAGSLTAAECVELHSLQEQMLRHRETIAPLPLVEAACNGVKRDRLVPDATTVPTAQNVSVFADGIIRANTPEAAKLIELLGLDSEQSTEFRMLWLGIIALADASDPELFQRLMGFPANLPDLARLRPPDGNVRHDGIHESYFAKRRNGVLPATY
jgi:hypothetical protein